MSINCPKCNTKNPDTVKFCGECGTQLPAPEKIEVTETIEAPKEELKRGTTFAGRYEIIEELGKGGMGRVYRAEDTKLKQEVALKLIKPEIAKDQKTIERFRNELKLARNIRHKNVCGMFDLGETEGAHFITMEYVRGEDLRGSIRRFGQLPIGKSISIAKQICEGLIEAHRLGVIHRDLKSNNIMIDKEGNVRIMDFGIARSLEAKGITGAGVMIGTPEYMSPEQVEGKEVDQRSDIYSLGIILYEMVTGGVPFEGDTPFIIGMKHKGEVPRNPREFNSQISADLNSMILRCLEKDKDKRYQSAGEVCSELINIEKGIPTTERVDTKKKPLTSKEITVTFGLKKFLIPALVVIALAVIATIIWQLIPQKEPVTPPPEKASVAVLSFEDLSPQRDQEHLCDGIAEELINRLNKLENLWVPARTSAFSLKDKELDIQEIGKKLNVKTVLEGSLRKAEEKLRITVRLVNVSDGNTLWSKKYERNEGDIFSLQDEISLAIVDSLKIKLLGKERVELVKGYTQNLEAYDLYLKGRFFWNKRTEMDLIRAMDYFEQAIEKDPNYANAYGGLADSYVILPDYSTTVPPKEAYSKARESALKALKIDDMFAAAHASLGQVKTDLDWDWEGGEREYLRAIELNPNYATAHHWYAMTLMYMARFDEAIREIKRARELDPLSLVINRNIGTVLFYARKYDQAIEALHNTLEIDSGFIRTHYFLGRVYIQKSMFEDALEELQKEKDLSSRWDQFVETRIGIAYAKLGKRSEAERVLDEMIEHSKEEYVSPYLLSLVNFALGENDRGFDLLEKAIDARGSGINYLRIEPVFDSVRSDPRYTILLKKVGLD
jgi:serine/threonine protein kinase/Tfp pilus assembly protein PilF